MTLKIFADEDVPRLIVTELRARGYDVTWGCEFDTGALDSERLRVAWAEGRLVLTEDNDFAALVFVEAHQSVGIVRYALSGWRREAKAARVMAAFAEHAQNFTGHITVFEPAAVRSQPMPKPLATGPKP